MSEINVDCAQKPQRNCTFMNFIPAEQSHIMQASVDLLNKVQPSARDRESVSVSLKNAPQFENRILFLIFYANF
jgi:hypothetical protein